MRPLIDRTGLLVATNAGGAPRFVGSCFAFRHPGYFLTATHCIPAGDAVSLSLTVDLGGRIEHGLAAQVLARHPQADAAVLHSPTAANLFQPFLDINEAIGPGADVMAFGYPEDSLVDGIQPVPRQFRGSVQRIFEHTSHRGYRYEAVELSFGAPGGLSGGPLATSQNSLEVCGIVVENIRSSTYLETITEVTDGPHTHREEVHAVINYGIAVSLAPLRDWLASNVPQVVA